MNIIDIINKKRLGKELSYKELEYAFLGYLNKQHEDYQMSSLLMAIVINGMTLEETIDLTDIFIKSGDVYDLSSIDKNIVDKHSTGGVGDSTTLIVGPIVASCGLKMAKISGRGLGITGGTIDKLESIPNFDVKLTKREFLHNLKTVGFVDSSQTTNLVPLDKIIYNLRNNSGTTESLPLIVSSIMSKKIASGADIILIDIKVGKGALVKTKKDANLMSRWMKEIGVHYNKKVVTIITDMNTPLSNSIGNALEVEEAMQVLKGKDCKLYEVSKEISSILISLAKNISMEEAQEEVEKSIISGRAYNKFLEFVKSQKGDIKKLKIDANIKVIKSKYNGTLKEIDALKIGRLALKLGAGKINDRETIDYSAGVKLYKNIGDKVKKGEILATLYTNKNIKITEDDINCFEIN
ncbi:MAG: thymidine phosphorylase [Bacilli bacterium]|nr:thymidine phosphorylase [Bacilli bacterium]